MIFGYFTVIDMAVLEKFWHLQNIVINKSRRLSEDRVIKQKCSNFSLNASK